GESRAHLSGAWAILVDCYGGAIKQVAPHATAFAHRHVLFCIQYLSYNGGADWLRSASRSMAPYVTGGAYFNYTDPELKDWQEAYYGSNYPRLLHVRREVDQKHYFSFPQAMRHSLETALQEHTSNC